MPDSKPKFLITVDVEDWFQVENFKAHIPYAAWSRQELRVESSTRRLLDLFDNVAGSRVQGVEGSRENNLTLASEISDRNERSGFHRASSTNQTNKTEPMVRATFFILGWLAERLPGLVREIHNRGHEVASHGYRHELCSRQSHSDLKKDLIRSRHLLEDITGSAVQGYRAPSFSVDNDTLRVIEDAGYAYDSSYNAFALHGRYGRLNTDGFQRQGIALQLGPDFHELPISNLFLKPIAYRLKPVVLPFSGGGYFRLIPSGMFNAGVRAILKKEAGYLFYMHPWEIDPSQPRVDQAPAWFKFRHYLNLDRTEKKIARLIREFKNCDFKTCWDYIQNVSSYSYRR